MEKFKNQRLVFALPEGTTIIEVIFEILKNNGLEETHRESYLKSTEGKDSRLIILRDAAVTIFEKKIPESKLVELLAKHLETPKEVAGKIVIDIKQKLISFVRIINIGEDSWPAVVISKPENNPPLSYDKKVETKSVEENAKKMDQNLTNEKEELTKVKTVLLQEENKGPDDYREPIE